MSEVSSNNTPALDSQQQLKLEAIRPYLLDPREDYPEPYYMLEYNGTPFSTVGGIQAISGQKKNGKSFVLTILMAACLGGNSGRIQEYLPGLKVPQRTIDYLGHEPRVLYVDTEMEKLNSAKVLRRVHWLVDGPASLKTPNDRFNVLWLKNLQRGDNDKKDYRRRYDIIKMAIDVLTPDIVFIDGLRDLLSSINDEENGTQILAELASLAEERHMCIWNALHQNPKANSDGEDAKMRGWIGTELGNKVSDTLISIKSKTASGVTFTVKQQDARGKDMDDFKFEVTEDAGNLGIPRIITGNTQRTEKISGDDPAEIRRWIEIAQERHNWPLSRSEIKKLVFADIGGQLNHGKQDVDLDIAINMGYLTESTLKKKGSYMLEPPQDMPF